ncbi:aspartate/tyrosine/aromatic aminotransferase [Cenarchaeum symbiosum A]|uniref:Aminotransferase n=1 Tax=Cenarchaeum symbiosum (strain A) TaxID=414004 RepID=A0RU39_CENSY|nr:aspartate/tyrosine/aromatic aminotransferase [Cenarchaeum symbiosum A]
MPDIEDLRNRMDDVTLLMERLLKERIEISRKIGRMKMDAGLDVTDGRREAALRTKVAEFCDLEGLDTAAAARLLAFLLEESVHLQAEDRPSHLSIFLKAKKLEEQGRRIIHMEVGDPDFGPPKGVEHALAEACRMGQTGYGPPAGEPVLRAALAHHARRFGPVPGPENVIVSPGARFAIFSAMSHLLGPGDGVIVVGPAWPAYSACADHVGAKVSVVDTRMEDNWDPKIAEIEAAMDRSAKMMVINYPNNPTGRVPPKGTMDGIMGLARERGLYVLSDEIYSSYSTPEWASVLEYGYERAIAVQSFSKSHAMTGFRVGYAVADPGVIRGMARIHALCLTSVPGPIQHAALRALDYDVSEWPGTVRKRLEMMSDEAESMGLEFVRPDGAMYLFVKTGTDGSALADTLLEQGLAVAPGEGFGKYKDFIRLSACADEGRLAEGMRILRGALG